MKRTLLAVALLAVAVSSVASQKSTSQTKKTLKQVEITTRTITRQPASKAYVIDLTRAGKIYSIANGIDYNRIRVRTAKGEMTVTELLKKTGKNISGKLSIGTTSDIRAKRIGVTRVGGARLQFDCGDLACGCTDPDSQDCIDMFDSGKCGVIAVCYPDGYVCLRI